MMPFLLPRRLYQDIVSQALADSPRECCGLLGGRGGKARTCYPLRNQATDPEREYFAAPEDLFAAMRAMREAGERLVAIYHSHPHGAAQPSQTDLALAFYPEVVYLIVALRPEVEIGAFRLLDQTSRRIPLRIID